jgi:hypothetical protein
LTFNDGRNGWGATIVDAMSTMTVMGLTVSYRHCSLSFTHFTRALHRISTMKRSTSLRLSTSSSLTIPLKLSRESTSMVCSL